MSLQKAQQIANIMGSIAGNVATAKQNIDNRKSDTNYQKYMSMIQMGQNPEQSDVDVDHKVLFNVYQDIHKKRLNDQTYRENQLILMNKERDVAQASLADNLSKMEGALSAGDDNAAKRHAIGAYKHINNGENIQIDETDGKMYVVGIDKETGKSVKKEEFHLPDWETVRTMGKQMLTKDNFNKIWTSNYQSIRAQNVAAYNEASKDPVVNSNGKVVGFLGRFQDPKSGIPDWQFSDMKTAGTVPWEDAQRKGMMLQSTYQGRKSGEVKQDGSKSSGGTPHSTQKLAEWYSQVYNVDMKDATDLVRREMQEKDARGILLSLTNQGLLDPTVMEDREAAKLAYSKLIGDLDVPLSDPNKSKTDRTLKVFSSGSDMHEARKLSGQTDRPDVTPKAAGLQEGGAETAKTGDELKATSGPQSKYPDAQQMQDGNWYVQRDGKWYRVKTEGEKISDQNEMMRLQR